jgi:hypothetical protein
VPAIELYREALASACPNPSPENVVLEMCCDRLYREAYGVRELAPAFSPARASFHLESAGKPARSKRFATKAGGSGSLARHFSRKDEGKPALLARGMAIGGSKSGSKLPQSIRFAK